jgi:Tfp pilus assembly protein PilF
VGNFARAYYYANKALKINPDDAEASLYGALSAVKLSKNEDAKLLFDMAIKGEPKIPEAYYDYAVFLEKQKKDLIHALAIYEEYEDQFGPILQTSLSIAKLYSQLGEKQKASDKYREILLSGFKMTPSLKRQIMKNIDKLCGKKENEL